MDWMSMGQKIINLLPVGLGGGLQNSLSFLTVLAGDRPAIEPFVVFVKAGSPLHCLVREQGLPHEVARPSRVGRLVFEVQARRCLPKGQTCLTLFGPPMVRSSNHLVNIVGCAYSNLFYPEIHFWSFLPLLKRTTKEMVDAARRAGTAKADIWIFETGALARRAVELCGFPADRVGVVRMAASTLVGPEKVKPEIVDHYERWLPQRPRLLHLCGAHPNKRLHSLPALAANLKQRVSEFVFVLTVSASSLYLASVMEQARQLGVDRHFVNVGPCPPENVASLISCCQAMCTFSRLESFSNNFVEAWRMNRPLIVTDADWARDSCGAGAMYVNPEAPDVSADALAQLMRQPSMQQALVEEGCRQLGTYPDPQAKNKMYYEWMDKAAAMGPCPEHLRRRIHWPRIRH
jgi:glycosyltransferase involved in cell wall biosynthesis